MCVSVLGKVGDREAGRSSKKTGNSYAHPGKAYKGNTKAVRKEQIQNTTRRVVIFKYNVIVAKWNYLLI